MIHHVLGPFTHPDQEWQEIRGEEETISHMYLTHILALAAIPAMSALHIGTTQVGWSIGDRAPVMLTEASALQMTIMTYLAMLAGVGGDGRIYPLDGAHLRLQSLTSLNQRCLPLTPPHRSLSAGWPRSTPTCGWPWWSARQPFRYTVLPALRRCAQLTFAGIPEDEGFMFSSSVLAVGLVVLVAMIAASVILWGFGVGPVYTS
ncbi:MAG: Yip1 family protein [Agrobacterium sp.]|nr:Yip1 family protein [Agrobacterium sp.]